MSAPTAAGELFAAPRAGFEELAGWLAGTQAGALTHGELEEQVDRRGREVLRQLVQDHLDLRAERETRLSDVADADAVRHGSCEPGHARPLATIFGPVQITRLAYRARGQANLHPADAALNLPAEKHSHGLRRLAAVEGSRGSFDEAAAAIGRSTGQRVGKRQVEELAARAAVDVEDFYASQQRAPADGNDVHSDDVPDDDVPDDDVPDDDVPDDDVPDDDVLDDDVLDDDVLVLSADGKGIVMRPESLRSATAKAAAAATTKLATRLSKGEKRHRKRIAEVGAVYDLTPVPRTAAQIMAGDQGGGEDRPAAQPVPKAANKWLTASVVDDAADVLARVFDEADRRDPGHERTWVALVDGNNHQIDRIQAEATARGVTVTVVIDFVHVLEYLWAAAWCFYAEADPAAEAWVRDRALAVLNGNATAVAAGLRRRATTLGLPATKRKKADDAARYLTNKAPYLDYPTALARGWPIATGVIEGACRHLVKDRMDITGARWSAEGAEAVLKLRAVHANGDFDQYWPYHLDRERERIHASRYADGVIPVAA